MVLWTVWQFKIETEFKHDNDYEDKSLKKKSFIVLLSVNVIEL